ncbi:MAG: permease-like cell division protein FtsX [Candidatus Paceibacterota bacterium]
MFWTNVQRVVRAGFVNFWRSGFVSLSSVVVMVTTLLVIGSLLFVGTLLSSTLSQIESKVDINVYFNIDADEGSILVLKQNLENLPEVSQIEYVDRDEALAKFKERHKDDITTLQALEEIGDNPLGGYLNITARQTSQYEGIVSFLDSEVPTDEEGNSIIQNINYNQNRVAIDRLTQIIESAERFGIAVTVLFVVMSVMITFNTIRLAIFVSKEEISIMRLVGASNMYIRGPFVVVGMMYGLASGIIAILIFYPVTYWLGPITQNFFTGINIFHYYLNNFGSIFLVLVGSGVLLGAISSYLAVRRYLKV